ncbi:hypothetical protein TEA_018056 [Camellia sinensis var. sinensis]|uniref:RNase H type-1 domain-containing protein n=1 Tax=Camellia sinensis var. sinensis TaxID=542762 RepID=A0A4S4EXY1_CAMSN|nr:hypothetical protein TEA_018056 [Camellia sinensis var. sinensis]
MWAVLTIVVVFDFSVGATLGRGVNRGFATLLAGTLGVGAHQIASFSGEILSGYRDDEVLEMAHRRLSTILIGGASAVIVCVCICPYVVLVLSRASSHLSIRQIMVGPILWHMLVWPGATLLNNYLSKNPEMLSRCSVIELGSGVGLMVERLEWGNSDQLDQILNRHPGGFDLVLGADIYILIFIFILESSIPLLFDTVQQLLHIREEGNCKFLLAYVSRAKVMDAMVISEAISHGLQITEIVGSRSVMGTEEDRSRTKGWAIDKRHAKDILESNVQIRWILTVIIFWLEINFYAVFGWGIWGGIWKGKWKRDCVDLLQSPVDSINAEAQACLSTLMWAAAKGISCISILTDCQVLVDALNKRCASDWNANMKLFCTKRPQLDISDDATYQRCCNIITIDPMRIWTDAGGLTNLLCIGGKYLKLDE